MMEKMQSSLKSTQTPDITLRKFHESKEVNFEKWLEVYWLYLNLIQTVKRSDIGLANLSVYNKLYDFVDKRYSTFISDYLLDNKENFSLLSWNYDIQFELAYMHMKSYNSFDSLHNEINIWPNVSNSYNKDKPNFLIHLNGTSMVYESLFDKKETIGSNTTTIEHSMQHFEQDISIVKALNKNLWILNSEGSHFKKLDNTLKFAFTNTEDQIKQLKTEIANSIKGFHKIVIIGYSFPKVNQKIDEYIFLQLNSNAEIIIQNPISQKRKLISRFKIPESRIIEISEIEEMNEFIIE